MKKVIILILVFTFSYLNAQLLKKDAGSETWYEYNFNLESKGETTLSVKRSELKQASYLSTSQCLITSYTVSFKVDGDLFSKKQDGTSSLFLSGSKPGVATKVEGLPMNSKIWIDFIGWDKDGYYRKFNCIMILED